MSEWDDTEMVETLAESVMQRISAAKRPMYVPATVVGADTTVNDDKQPLTAVPYFTVHVDSDPAGVTIQAAAFARWPFTPGDRVMVAWDWPHAAYIVYPLQGVPDGRPYSTFVVASSLSFAPGHESADYVCDGVDDHEQLLDAFQVITDGGVPGRVLLLEGRYFMPTDVLVIPALVTLAGLGRDVVTLEFEGGGVAFGFTGGTLEDLEAFIPDGSGWDMSGTDAGVIRRVDFTTQGGV